MEVIGSEVQRTEFDLRQPTYTPAQKFALLARILHRFGYADALAGHITWRQPDDLLLVNPFEIGWDEMRASDVSVIDRLGQHVSGEHHASQAVQLHVALHLARPELNVIVHNHPEFGTVWAGAGRVPPVYDQTSANLDAEIACIPYTGPVLDPLYAADVAKHMATAEVALLENHGVLIIARSVEVAIWRAYTLERRCRLAWRIEAIGGGQPMRAEHVAMNRRVLRDSFDGIFPGLFEHLARREVRLDTSVLV